MSELPRDHRVEQLYSDNTYGLPDLEHSADARPFPLVLRDAYSIGIGVRGRDSVVFLAHSKIY